MKIQVVLGNQLFPIKHYERGNAFFMCEDISLCSHFKYHKHKIIFFIASMRHFSKQLVGAGGEVEYFELSGKEDFFVKLKEVVSKRKITEISVFEIEDKFFETKIREFCHSEKLELDIKQSPMFINSRVDFKEYLSNVKKPFMKTFYESWRKRSGVLMTENGPVGGKFSFDVENRKKIPKKFDVIKNKITRDEDGIIEQVKLLVTKFFDDHPGDVEDFWLAVNRDEALEQLNIFFKNKLKYFGDFEDALDQRDPFLYHSVLSPYLNIGFLTPAEIIEKTLKQEAPINSQEGFIRQVGGWREFIRGVYQNYSDQELSSNFFNHKRKLSSDWYQGTTGIEPLDQAIKKALKFGYCHHIERLMIISNIMLLCEIDPKDVYKWFMEMFVDSSDWVMVPNVFGMSQFSDGGIFATKPYICGSNYILKMGHYQKGPWCDVLDGLYWRFIEKKKDFFIKNHRMKMMVSLLDKMDPTKKKHIFAVSEQFLKEKTL